MPETYCSEKALTGKAPKDCLVAYDGHKYSLPPAYAGKTSALGMQDDNLSIYNNITLVQSHRIADKLITYDPDDYKSLLMHNMMNEENMERIMFEMMNKYFKSFGLCVLIYVLVV